MKRWRWLAVGAVAYLAMLAALAPANLLDVALARWSGARLRFVEAHGTVWSGSGVIEMRDAGERTRAAKHVRWRLSPMRLLAGAVVVEARTDDSANAFAVTLSRAGVQIEDAQLRLPASVLVLAVPRLAPFELTGSLLVTIPRLALRDGRIAGSASAQWLAAGIAVPGVPPLGAYELRVDASDAGVSARLERLEGPVELAASGSWPRGSPRALRATARVPASHQPQLGRLLRLIAVERGAGVYELAFD